MVVIAYAHDGTSIYGVNIYDLLFLNQLLKENRVYFLTFSECKHPLPRKVLHTRMKEPLASFTKKREWIEGLRMYLLWLLRSILFRLQLRNIKPSVLLGCMATKYGFYAALSGFRPFILIVWGSDVLIAPKRFFLSRFMAKYSLRKANAVFLDSEIQKQAVIQLGCDPKKIMKFPWFNLQSVHVKVSRSDVRKALGWVNKSIVISTRSHESIYGVQYLVEAIPRVVSAVPDSRFLIIGTGRLTHSFRRRIKELGVEKYVRFTGSIPREEVFSYINASDLNASMSMSDGASASLLEAMALGTPSIVTDIPGNREWIENYRNGCLVPVNDSETLAETIVSLLKDENLRRELGRKATETVRAKADWSKSSQAIAATIEGLVYQKAKRKV